MYALGIAPSRNYYFYHLKNFSQFKTGHGTIFKNYWAISDCHNRSIIFNLNVSMYKLANLTFQSRDILKQRSAESIIQNLRARRSENKKSIISINYSITGTSIRGWKHEINSHDEQALARGEFSPISSKFLPMRREEEFVETKRCDSTLQLLVCKNKRGSGRIGNARWGASCSCRVSMAGVSWDWRTDPGPL